MFCPLPPLITTTQFTFSISIISVFSNPNILRHLPNHRPLEMPTNWKVCRWRYYTFRSAHSSLKWVKKNTANKVKGRRILQQKDHKPRKIIQEVHTFCSEFREAEIPLFLKVSNYPLVCKGRFGPSFVPGKSLPSDMRKLKPHVESSMVQFQWAFKKLIFGRAFKPSSIWEVMVVGLVSGDRQLSLCSGGTEEPLHCKY